MKHLSKIIFIFIYTLLFTALIYVGKEIFFPSNYSEELYIEPTISLQEPSEFSSFSGVTQSEIDKTIHKLLYEEFSQKYEQEKRRRVDIYFIPLELKDLVEFSYLPLGETFLYHKWILPYIHSMKFIIHRDKFDTRGRMKAGNIHMYGVLQMTDEEFLSVLIHEFGHYFDIYSLPGNAFGDQSDRFYNISWNSVTRVKLGQNSSDFVSGYALTNKYEDFSESYVYFVLHNQEFEARAKNSSALQSKYDFFKNYVFPAGQFQDMTFSLTEEQQKEEYIWDVTKLPVDVKKFLQYLQDTI